jgi:hypothetical protein
MTNRPIMRKEKSLQDLWSYAGSQFGFIIDKGNIISNCGGGITTVRGGRRISNRCPGLVIAKVIAGKYEKE